MKKKNIAIMAMFMMSVLTLLITVIFFEYKNYKDMTKQKNTYVTEENNNLKVKDSSSSNQIENKGHYGTTNESESNPPDTSDVKSNTINDSGKDISRNDDNINIDLVFAGDVYLSSYVLGRYDQKGINGILSDELQKEFKDADIGMINQEFPFSNRGTKASDKQYTFRISPEYVSVFDEMGIDIVTLANNHVLDYGIDALLDTLTTLEAAQINYAGAGKNIEEAKKWETFEKQGKKIAILAASRVIPVTDWNATSTRPGLLTTYDPNTLNQQIKEAKKENDLVIVYVHWGIEKNTKPEEYQRNLAKGYIDAGADLVVGSHPHVLQGIEYYKNTPIIYSLGNFMFYNSIEKTALLKVRIDEENQIHLFLLPCFAENARTSVITNEKSKQDFFSYIKSLSYNILIDEEGKVSEILD